MPLLQYHLTLSWLLLMQAEATLYAKPRFEGCDVEVGLAGLDVMPLATATTPLDPVSNGQPVRVRLSGQLKLMLKPVPAAAPVRGGRPKPGIMFEGVLWHSASLSCLNAHC